MSSFIQQCKGKDLIKIPKSKLIHTGWYPSIKRDGNYVQIHKVDNEIFFYTSGGKRFYIEHAAQQLIEKNAGINFVIECEYIGTTEGKLGDRVKCSTGSYRSKFEKGLPSGAPQNIKFVIFDVLGYEDELINYGNSLRFEKFKIRKTMFKKLDLSIDCFELAALYLKTFNLDNIDSKSFFNKGWEGLFLIHEDHTWQKTRTNLAIKLKDKPTADLVCIDVEKGEPGSKYEECIGSLVLQDSKGRIVSVGSGLDDNQRRSALATWYIGKVIEIKYEQILETYIQPVYVRVRTDKTIKDIS